MNQPLSYIHPEAKIAKNVVVEPFAFIAKDVEIGEGSWIGPHVTIHEGARIGKNVQVFPGAVIAGVPQDKKFEGEYTTVEIGDGSVIREYVTISRGTKDKFKTKIGKDCLLMAYVHVAHDVTVGDNCILGNQVQLAGHIVINDWVIISALSAVHQFVHIGVHAFIAGASLVRKDVPPYIKAAREPLSFTGINSVGLRRRGYSNDKINEIQEIYRAIYLKGMNNKEAIEYVELQITPSSERDEIIYFIQNSDRGIIKGGTNGGGSPDLEEH